MVTIDRKPGLVVLTTYTVSPEKDYFARFFEFKEQFYYTVSLVACSRNGPINVTVLSMNYVVVAVRWYFDAWIRLAQERGWTSIAFEITKMGAPELPFMASFKWPGAQFASAVDLLLASRYFLELQRLKMTLQDNQITFELFYGSEVAALESQYGLLIILADYAFLVI